MVEDCTVSVLFVKIAGWLAQMPGVYLNGDSENRVAGVVNVGFDGVDGEVS